MPLKVLMENVTTLANIPANKILYQAPCRCLENVGFAKCWIRPRVSWVSGSAELYIQTAASLEGPWDTRLTITSVGTGDYLFEWDSDAEYPLDRYVRWSASSSSTWGICFAIRAEFEN
jgi:hypothetical protein